MILSMYRILIMIVIEMTNNIKIKLDQAGRNIMP